MNNIDEYTKDLLMSAKVFLIEAQSVSNSDREQRLLRSALVHCFFFLEAQISYVMDHFKSNTNFSILEKSIINEKDYSFKDGEFALLSKDKFYRLEDRIEFLIYKFSGKLDHRGSEWYSMLKNYIRLRNDIVHPKDNHNLSCDDIERAILSVVECVSLIYKCVFNKDFPLKSLGLHVGPVR